MTQRILVLDFGSQYNQLIVRSIRSAGVFAELRSPSIGIEEIKAYAPTALILSGGPASVYDEGSPGAPEGLFDLDIPILGICYGMQLMVNCLGGAISASDKREYGRAKIDKKIQDCPLTEGVELLGSQVWMSHGDSVTGLPAGFSSVASTSSTPYTIIRHSEKPLFGFQFHPEVVHTVKGMELLENFLFKVAGCQKDWEMHSYLETSLERIRSMVGKDERVILGLSGGVDSSVMAILLDRALAERVTCIFVDNGLLRLGEGEQVEETFKKHYHLNFIRIDASEKFLNNLKGVTDPEKKRKAIGNTFIEVFEEAIEHVPEAKWLAQGTIYPDVIESVATHGKSETIKSHHNVGGLPERMKLKILEPLRELFKDEVRALGRELGLPEEFIGRHPFPGPGLGVRILGEVTKEACDTLRKADHIYIEEIKKNGLYDEISQAFAVLLPVKSVGVMGDGRTYENVLALRAVTTTDFMTADWYTFDHDVLAHISNRIVGEVKGVNRVVYDVTSKPPGTIEWE